MNSQEALEAIQFLQQEARNEEERSTGASQRSASPLSLRLSPIAPRSAVSSPSSSFDNDDRHNNLPNHTRDASPIRTAFAQLLELSFESQIRHHDGEEENADTEQHGKHPIAMQQRVEDPLQQRVQTLLPPPPPPPPPPSPRPAFRSDDVSSTTSTEHIVTTKTHYSVTNPLASIDTSIVDENDDVEDESDDEDTFSEPFESSFEKKSRENSLETYELNETSRENSLDRSDRNYSINPQMNSILESDANVSKEDLATETLEDPDARNISAADLLDEHLDGLLASDKGNEEKVRGDAKGVAGRVNQTIHKIKEMATPYLPTKLPTTTCLSRDNEDNKTTYAKRPFPKNSSNDVTAVTVIDTGHISSVARDGPSKLLSVDQQRVPMMRMRHPAAQDFLTEHEASSPHHEEEFVKGTSQQSRAQATEKQRQRRVKESLNGPDDILVCNNVVWKGFENFVVSRCGNASDAVVEKAANRQKEASARQYSPACSVASEKSEGSESMMRRLSQRYLKSDATVVSSLDGSASNRSGGGSRPTQDAPITVLNPIPRHVTGASAQFPAQPAIREGDCLPADQFLTLADVMAKPLRAHVYLEDAKRGNKGDFWGPWLVWFIGDSPVRKGIDLFDIRSLDKASALQLEQYPLAMPGRSLLLLMNEGPDHVFEMQDEASAVSFVHGIRWLIAHLSFNLIAGNVNVSCDMIEVTDHQTPWLESHLSSLMNDLTNVLVDKSATAM